MLLGLPTSRLRICCRCGVPPANAPVMTELNLPGEPERWAAIGFELSGGQFALEQILCRVGAAEPSWSFTGGYSSPRQLCGIETGHDSQSATPKAGLHVNTATKVDHVVVTSEAPSATKREFESFGLVARGERVLGVQGAQRSQSFFWSGEMLVELVGPTGAPDDAEAAAAIWGVTFVVSELAALQEAAGELLLPARPAVQTGRQIVTVSGSAQLGVEVAFLTPHGINWRS